MNIKKIQLPLQTISLVLGFMVWVILSSLMPYIKEDIKLTCAAADFCNGGADIDWFDYANSCGILDESVWSTKAILY